MTEPKNCNCWPDKCNAEYADGDVRQCGYCRNLDSELACPADLTVDEFDMADPDARDRCDCCTPAGEHDHDRCEHPCCPNWEQAP